MLQIPAAVLPYPTPNYGNGNVSWSNIHEAKDGKWNLKGRKFLRCSSQTQFRVFIIAVPPEDPKSKLRSEAALQQVFDSFSAAAHLTYFTGKFTYVGYEISPLFAQPQVAHQAMIQAQNKGANFVILLLGSKSVSAYSIFKTLADRDFGVHSLCAVYKEDKDGKPFSDQYWGNVMMKVNLKAGGINHTVTKATELMKDTLVLGA